MNTELPKDWKYAKLGEVCEILDGKRRPINSSERNNRIAGKKKNQLFPYYGATGQVGYIDDYLLDGEYVLLGEDGAPFLEAFKDKAYIVNGKIWVNNHAHILKSYSSNRFLCYYLNQISYREYVTGTTRLKLNQSLMKEIPVVVPPLSEQHRIVAKLEELLSEIEKGKEQLHTALEQLKVYRQAVLKYAFEGKLTRQNRGLNGLKDDAENISESRMKRIEGLTQKNKNNNPRNPVIGEIGDSDNGELPKGWKWVTITEMIEKEKNSLKAGPFGSSLKKEFYVEKGYKIYGQEQVIRGDAFYGDYFISKHKYQELLSNRIKPLDVLVSLVGTVGKVLILPDNCKPGIINPRLIKISLNKKEYLPKFFKYYFESSTVKSFYSSKAQGTTMDVLNLGIIKTIRFPFCSIEEQLHVIEEIESRLSVADKLEETITASLQQTETLRQSILKKAFEGSLV